MRVVATIIAVLLLVQIGAASEVSVIGPENFLYPLKIWMEKFSLNFVFNQTEKTQRMLDISEERLREAEEMHNNSLAYERAMKEYADQLRELKSVIPEDIDNKTGDVRTNIKEKIEKQKYRIKALNSTGNISIIQQSIIDASSSSGESKIKVSVVNGNVSIYTEGGNASVTKDGGNVTVISVTNNSRQTVIVRSSQNSSSSSSIVVASSSVSSE